MAMSHGFGCFIGGLVGAVVGFLVGVFGYLGLFYLIFMLPSGTPFRHMDQGAIPVVFFGPLGTIVGGVVVGLVVRRRLSQPPQQPG
ncbi:hypothetical protein LLH23_13920 [bacterium]|nr:hypothetical protein [bacterium]